MGRRARLDQGVLGVIAVRVETARQAVGLIRGAHRRGLLRAQGSEVVVNSDEPTVPVGIDGETVQLSTPVRCTVRPRALRVRLPRERPGIRHPGVTSTGRRCGGWPSGADRPPMLPPAGITRPRGRPLRTRHPRTATPDLPRPGRAASSPGEFRNVWGDLAAPAAYTFFMVAVHREVEKKYAADEASSCRR